MDLSVHFKSNRQNWETPKELFKSLDKEFHFTLDPASSTENHKCEKYYTKKENGLEQSWKGERVFLNPPYSKELPKWIEKAYKEAKEGTLIVILMPSRTDTKYFHKYIYNKAEIRFIKGRIKFEIGGEQTKNSAPFPSMIVVYNNE